MPQPSQDEWIARVLGVAGIGEAGAAPDLPGADLPETDWPAAVAGWRAQSEAVDKELTGLQHYLQSTDDEDFHHIAEFGLNGIMEGHKAALLGTIITLERADAAALRAGAPGALKAVNAFKAHIENDPRVAACDHNHFGVKVAIRKRLAPALAAMQAALQQAQALS